MTRIIKNEIKCISIYLEEQYLEEILELKIEKFIKEKRELEDFRRL